LISVWSALMAAKHQYWFDYSKEGKASFHSHLETVRIFKRAVRRSGLDVRFTSGFNPHIRFSTPNALPVGLAVRAERFALCFSRAYDPLDIARTINGCLPDGFRVKAVPNAAEDRALEGEFEICFSGDLDAVREAAGLWLKQEAIVPDRRKNEDEGIGLNRYVERIDIEAGRMVIGIVPRDGKFPRLSELLNRFYAMRNYIESPFRIHGVTRL